MFNMNPQNFIASLMNNSKVNSNPIMQNAMTMYRNGDSKGLEELVNNVARQRGVSVDEVRRKIGM